MPAKITYTMRIAAPFIGQYETIDKQYSMTIRGDVLLENGAIYCRQSHSRWNFVPTVSAVEGKVYIETDK